MGLQPSRHVVVLSLMGVNPGTPHWQLERDVKASGQRWTMLRPAFFMQNLHTAPTSPTTIESGCRRAAGGGRTSFIEARDIADIAALALTQPGAHSGKAYTLTGGRAQSWTQVAAALTAELDRTISYQPIRLLRARKELKAATLPKAYVNIQLLINIVAKVGLAAKFTDAVPRLPGHPARTLSDYLHDYRQQWTRPTT